MSKISLKRMAELFIIMSGDASDKYETNDSSVRGMDLWDGLFDHVFDYVAQQESKKEFFDYIRTVFNDFISDWYSTHPHKKLIVDDTIISKPRNMYQ